MTTALGVNFEQGIATIDGEECAVDFIVHQGKRVGVLRFVKGWRRWRWTFNDAAGDASTRFGAMELVRLYATAQRPAK